MDMIKDVWVAAKKILNLSADIKLARPEQREKLAEILAKISDVLNDIYISLKREVYPAGNCTQLDSFSDELYHRCHVIIGDEKALELTTLLKPAHKLEKLFHEITNGLISYMELQKIEEASGKFKVGSIIIK